MYARLTFFIDLSLTISFVFASFVRNSAAWADTYLPPS